jgi:hypothetical protein
MTPEDIAKRQRVENIWRETTGFSQASLAESEMGWRFFIALLDADPTPEPQTLQDAARHPDLFASNEMTGGQDFRG